jgi:hypothetical protein
LARAEWVEKRKAQILQTYYFHVVFTLPEQIAAIAYQNKDLVFLPYSRDSDSFAVMLQLTSSYK